MKKVSSQTVSAKCVLEALELPKEVTLDALRTLPVTALRRLMPDVAVGSKRYCIAMRLRQKLKNSKRDRATTRLFQNHVFGLSRK